MLKLKLVLATIYFLEPKLLNRRDFLLGSGITASGLLGGKQPIYALTAKPFLSNKEDARSCQPADPLQALLEGNSRFAEAWQSKNIAASMDKRSRLMANLWLENCFLPAEAIVESQAPWAAVLACADSRAAPEWIFDAAPADLFVIRSAGNTAFDNAIASMEYGVQALKISLIMVMGHQNCGAVAAARRSDSLTPLLEKLVAPIRDSFCPGVDFNQAVCDNAVHAARQLTQRSLVLSKAKQQNQLKIVPAYFEIESGRVTLLE
ncbi:carbonic anhydrase [cyanobiont of Ornithocercus magnificus]|nr:carbonic anhydrase [cyanobiont of Ornithocercus magnificus]